MTWVRSDLAAPAGTFSQANDLLADWRATMGLTANLPGLTVVRVRGALQWVDNGGPNASSGHLIGVKVGDMSNPPDPVTGFPSVARHEDWMAFDWQPFAMPWAGGSSDATVDISAYALDVKSKRRLDEPQQTLYLAWEATRDATTSEFYGWVSVLLALP